MREFFLSNGVQVAAIYIAATCEYLLLFSLLDTRPPRNP